MKNPGFTSCLVSQDDPRGLRSLQRRRVSWFVVATQGVIAKQANAGCTKHLRGRACCRSSTQRGKASLVSTAHSSEVGKGAGNCGRDRRPRSTFAHLLRRMALLFGKVCLQLHRIVQNAADLDGARFGYTVEQEMTRAAYPVTGSTRRLAAEEKMIGSAMGGDFGPRIAAG